MAQTGKHTAGPWMDWQQDHENVISEHQRDDGSFPIIAIVRGANKDANARLIAAAPDMKAALLPLLEVVDEEIEQRKFSGNDEYWQGLQALSDAGHAAIAKAEGR